MNTDSINDIERDTKRADQLAVGDHVIEQPGHEQDDQPMRVTAAQPYLDGNRRPMVSLLLDALDGTEPMYVRVKPEKPYDLATAGDLAALTAGARRTAMVRALHQLAADIAEHKLPVPRHTLHIGGVVESRAALEAWAAHLGAEIEAGGTDGDIPALRHEVKVPDGPTFYVGWQSPIEPKPEPLQDWYFTFGSGHTHPESPSINPEGGESLADRYVVIRGTYESARAIMLRFFGRVWCDQYASAEKAGVEQFGLTELARRHWPTPQAADATQAGE